MGLICNIHVCFWPIFMPKKTIKVMQLIENPKNKISTFLFVTPVRRRAWLEIRTGRLAHTHVASCRVRAVRAKCSLAGLTTSPNTCQTSIVDLQPTVIASRASPPLLEQSSSTIRRIVDARRPSKPVRRVCAHGSKFGQDT